MTQPAIEIKNLSKRYRLGNVAGFNRTFREMLCDTAGRILHPQRHGESKGEGKNDFWALTEINLDIAPGEVVGLIGHNGAGKSTLLKVLSRITDPTDGQVTLRGRVGSLLEVGTGFHPELSGRENIFLNGTILGMTRREIKKHFEDIVAFAEVERFLDTPVKRYSSGMFVRLAFAVAAHLNPEILLVDEVLAVGDASFQKKCLGKMSDVARQGRTVVFVSHNMAAIEGLCHRAVLLKDGHIYFDGDTRPAISEYLNTIQQTITHQPLATREDRSGNGDIRFTDFRIENGDGQVISTVRSGQDVTFAFDYSCKDNSSRRDIDVGFGVIDDDGKLLFILYSGYVGQLFNDIPSQGTFRCNVARLPLSAGRYRIGARITRGGIEVDWPNDGIGYIEVLKGDFYGSGTTGISDSPFLVDGQWQVGEDHSRTIRNAA